jgi:hypothetical protein
MSVYLKKLWNDYGIGGVLIVLVVLYGLFMLYKHLMSKGTFGSELMSQDRKKAYDNSFSPSGPQPAQESGNEVFSSVNGSSQLSDNSLTTSSNNQNPADLLPKDNNSSWAQLNPVGKGPFNDTNLMKATHLIGIDTVGTSLRNANLQLRSEPANPKVSVGPWMNSTIENEPDFRPAFEIGQGQH